MRTQNRWTGGPDVQRVWDTDTGLTPRHPRALLSSALRAVAAVLVASLTLLVTGTLATAAPVDEVFASNDGSPKGVPNLAKRPGRLPRGVRGAYRTDLPRDFVFMRGMPHFDYAEWNFVSGSMREGYMSAAVAYGEHFADRDPERALQAFAWIQKGRHADAVACNKAPNEVDAWVNALSPGLIEKLEHLAASKPAHYYRGLREAANWTESRREYMYLCAEVDLRPGRLTEIYFLGANALRGIMQSLKVKNPNEIEATDLPLPFVEAPAAIRWSAPIAWLDEKEILLRKREWISKDQRAARSHSRDEPASYIIWNWVTNEVRAVDTQFKLDSPTCTSRGQLVGRGRTQDRRGTVWRWSRTEEATLWIESAQLDAFSSSDEVEINPIDCTVLPLSRPRRGAYEWPLPDKSGALIWSNLDVGWLHCEGMGEQHCRRLEAGRTPSLTMPVQVPWLDALAFIESTDNVIHPIAVAIWKKGVPMQRLEHPEMHYMTWDISLSASRVGLISTLGIGIGLRKEAFEQSGVYRVTNSHFERIRQGDQMTSWPRFQVSPDGCSIVDPPRYSRDNSIDLPLGVFDACALLVRQSAQGVSK